MKGEPRRITPKLTNDIRKRRATPDVAGLPKKSKFMLQRPGKKGMLSASQPHSKTFGH